VPITRPMAWVRAQGSDRGASIIEFALLGPVMIVLVMGVIDLARGYRSQIRLENAAREGAAFAQIYPNDVTCGDFGTIEAHAMSEDPDMGGTVRVFGEDAGGELTVPVLGCGGDVVVSGERVLVEVSASFDVMTPMIESIVGNEIVLTGSAEIEAQG
jgi:Flp pilus assembly protein TadG